MGLTLSHVPAEPRRITLTDRALRALKPPKDGKRGQPTYDAVVPGLCVRVGARAAVFYVTKRVAEQFKWIRLGIYPVMPLADARIRAREVLSAISEGRPPPAPVKSTITFADAAERFIAECLIAKRTARASEQTIRRELIPTLGNRPITSISHDDLVKLLRDIADRPERRNSGRFKSGGPHAARKARAELSPLLKWAAFNRIGGLQHNPLSAIVDSELLRGRQYVRARDRVLSDRELRIVWRAAGETPYPLGPLLRGLILTGQRLNELARAQWSEIDTDVGCLLVPASRMKNKQAQALPLTAQMRALLDTLPHFTEGDFIFSTTAGKRPVSGFSKWKTAFDKRVAAIGPVAPWRIHDLRRTTRTGLSRAGVLPFYAELVIAHIQAGVHATYDLHRYSNEKAEALRNWENLLFDIVGSPPAESPPPDLALAVAS
jgi:integrase